jgi:hypothetical protein
MRRLVLRVLLHPLAGAAIALACLLLTPASAGAQGRPSLVTLDQQLGQVVDGLCGGDASQCGAPPAVANGRIEVDANSPSPVVLDLVDLEMTVDVSLACGATPSCSPGAPVFREARATVVVPATAVARLGAAIVGGVAHHRVDVVLYNPQLASDERLLRFENAPITRLEQTEVAGRYLLGWEPALSELTVSWNGLPAAGECIFELDGDPLVDLAGMDPSVLDPEPDAVAATLALQVKRPVCVEPMCPAPLQATYHFERALDDPCLIATFGYEVRYRYLELWGGTGPFPPELRVQREVRPAGNDNEQWMTRYSLRVADGVPSEVVDVLLHGSFDVFSRTFDPLTGDPVEELSEQIDFQ